MKQLDHNQTPTIAPPRPITLICDGITLSANIGGIFRLADAFGVDEIIFGGDIIDTSSRKIKHVSRSTHNWVKHRNSEDLTREIQDYKAQGFKIIALEITSQSLPLAAIDFPKETQIVLVIGSEIAGVSESILYVCDAVYHIPMFGKNSSMNVTNALGILLYELTRDFIREEQD